MLMVKQFSFNLVIAIFSRETWDRHPKRGRVLGNPPAIVVRQRCNAQKNRRSLDWPLCPKPLPLQGSMRYSLGMFRLTWHRTDHRLMSNISTSITKAIRRYMYIATQICINTAYREVPRKNLVFRFSLIHLKNSSICQRSL